jgi:hypothetical protein
VKVTPNSPTFLFARSNKALTGGQQRVADADGMDCDAGLPGDILEQPPIGRRECLTRRPRCQT